MSSTPICDFVREYSEKAPVRVHMPGHKGKGEMGIEHLDITEIDSADYLYNPKTIIAQSEANATRLFGTRNTFYSCEGSSQVIKSMIALANTVKHGDRLKIIASRNAHKSFVYACALVDVDVVWLVGDTMDKSLCRCSVTAEDVAAAIAENPDCDAVYLTSPDYLGNILDIRSIAEVCSQSDILLLVDNAHGAYLNFLDTALHPIALGADMCADSAHKTLPVLTGGAYLHISQNCKFPFEKNAKIVLEAFGSTSPSFLILQSLDSANDYLDNSFRDDLRLTCKRVVGLKEQLRQRGYILQGNDPLRICIDANEYGYTGDFINEHLREDNIYTEYHDDDFVVMMMSVNNTENDFSKIENSLSTIEKRKKLKCKDICFTLPERQMTIRKSFFSPNETVPFEEALGRVLALPTSLCPPCIAIGVSGEVVDKNMIDTCRSFGIKQLTVVC